MAEPLSITVGVLSILKVCTAVGNELKKFHSSVKHVDDSINSLIRDVTGLKQMLEAMRDTLGPAKNSAYTQQSGHIGAHWRNISQALADGEKSLTRLANLLQLVYKDTKILDGTRKMIRLNSATEQINGFKSQIQTSRDVLSLSMQSILL
jgi:hypothetical protein